MKGQGQEPLVPVRNVASGPALSCGNSATMGMD